MALSSPHSRLVDDLAHRGFMLHTSEYPQIGSQR